MTETNRKPADFEWVTERNNCSLRQMFEKMLMGVTADVESRNKHLSEHSSVRKVKIANHGNRMKVFIDDPYGEFVNTSVPFVLGKDAIEVRGGETNAELFKVGIGMNDQGDCMFVISGCEYDSWQIRRKALEGLFFDEWFNHT